MLLFSSFETSERSTGLHVEAINACLLKISIFITLVLNVTTTSADLYIDNERDWTLTFYTGDKIWSGTDSIINAQIYGIEGKSDIIQLIPNRLQMEARSVDRFDIGEIDTKKFGTIQSITIAKQHSYAFFNDWELIKVELTDPQGNVYLFNCYCWLTTLKYKQNIELYSINGVQIQKAVSANDEGRRRTFTAFPVTVSLLLLLLMLIVFSYFGNLVARKWRENLSAHRASIRRNQTRNVQRRLRRANNNSNMDDLFKDDDDENSDNNMIGNRERIYNFTNDLSNVNTNMNLNRSTDYSRQLNTEAVASQQMSVITTHLSNEDKPPDYKELFPHQQNIQMQETSTNVSSRDETERTKLSNV